MGVRFVAVGRVPAGSVMYYSIAIVLYSVGTVPDVLAELTLPPEVEFLSTEPPATEEPGVGENGGVVRWELGALTGPTNRPLVAAVKVREDLDFGTTFRGFLRVSNGLGKVKSLRRLSRIGNGNRPRR